MVFDVIDDFLPQPYFEMIRDKITHCSFPWYFKKDITYPSIDSLLNKNLNSYGLDHFVIEDNESCNVEMSSLLSGFFGSLMLITERSKISKCRIDMTLHTKPKYKHTPHVDMFTDHIASVFYLTNSDGETEIYDEICYSMDQYVNTDFSKLTLTHQVEPKENRLLLFDGKYLHTGHSPFRTKNRVIINTDLV